MEQYIVFVINDQNFAADISSVERIIEFKQPKRTPETLDYYLGVTQYNGEILPIIDLGRRLYKDCTSTGENSRVIVTLWKGRYIGLLVDDVIGVQNFGDGQFEKANRNMNISKDYITGFIKEEEQITIALDIDRIFSTEQGQEQELLLAMDSH